MVGFGIFCLFFLIPDILNEALTLPEELYNPLLITRILLAPLGWGAMPSDNLINAAYYLAIFFGFLGLVGWRTNLSIFLFAILMILLQSYIYSFGEIHHREAVLMIALVALAFSPCGRHWSLDAVQGRGFNPLLDSGDAQQTHSTYTYWPIFVCKVFMALMYLSAVFNKLTASGFGWANGYTLQAYMAQDGMRWGSDLGIWFSQQHELLLVGQIAVLIFQFTFWLVLFIPRLGWIYYPLGLGFHIMIYVTLKAPFWHWIAIYFLFIPYSNIYRAYKGEIEFKDILTAH